MTGVYDVFNLPIGEKIQKDEVILSSYEFSSKEDILFNLRAARDGGGLFYMEDGKYVRLNINGELVMSDTRMEKISNSTFVASANGKVLIGGLGIGLILKNIWNKLVSNEITHITIIEKYQSVIDIISPYYQHQNITIICADMMKWNAPKQEKFDTIYFDIWSTISTDNLKEIKTLHNRFKNKLNRNNPNCFMNSWMKEYLQRLNRNSY